MQFDAVAAAAAEMDQGLSKMEGIGGLAIERATAMVDGSPWMRVMMGPE